MFSRELRELTEFICDEEEDILRRYKGDQQVKHALLYSEFIRPFKLNIFGVDLSKAPISSMYRWTGGRKTKGNFNVEHECCVYDEGFFILPTFYQDYFHCLWNSNIWKIYNLYGWKNLELGYPKDRLIDLL